MPTNEERKQSQEAAKQFIKNNLIDLAWEVRSKNGGPKTDELVAILEPKQLGFALSLPQKIEEAHAMVKEASLDGFLRASTLVREAFHQSVNYWQGDSFEPGAFESWSGKRSALDNQAISITKVPRVLVTTEGGMIRDHASDGVDFQHFDFDDWANNKEYATGSLPAHFKDLAEELNVPAAAIASAENDDYDRRSPS